MFVIHGKRYLPEFPLTWERDAVRYAQPKFVAQVTSGFNAFDGDTLGR